MTRRESGGRPRGQLFVLPPTRFQVIDRSVAASLTLNCGRVSERRAGKAPETFGIPQTRSSERGASRAGPVAPLCAERQSDQGSGSGPGARQLRSGGRARCLVGGTRGRSVRAANRNIEGKP